MKNPTFNFSLDSINWKMRTHTYTCDHMDYETGIFTSILLSNNFKLIIKIAVITSTKRNYSNNFSLHKNLLTTNVNRLRTTADILY